SPPTFPDGLDTEVFTFQTLKTAWSEALDGRSREHVTPFMRESGRFRCVNLANRTDESGERWTVDEPADFEVIRAVFEHFHPRANFDWQAVLELRRQQPELFAANRNLTRNQGMQMGTGQKLWRRAKRIIPGGNMLLSKRAELFLPDKWPAYFSRAQG